MKMNVKQVQIDYYRYYDPLFEGARIILNALGEAYTPEYISGISGSAFKIAAGCPSRPTCVKDFWPPEFFGYMGYEIKEYPASDIDKDMVEAVKESIDNGKPALVWHAFREEEWDVVCGYDEEAKQFIGWGTYGGGEYRREPWDRAKNSNVYGFGAIVVREKTSVLNEREAEISSLKKAVEHARKESGEEELAATEGIQGYKKWAEMYSKPGADRSVACAYCHETYSSVRRAAVIYLNGLADKYGGGAAVHLKEAASFFAKEAAKLDEAAPYITWSSPWGVDEPRSKNLAPILKAASEQYEKGIESIEKALAVLA
jgi:hypothetical protein